MSQLILKHPDFQPENVKFDTVVVHAGEPRDTYGSLIPPIYQTSTFYFASTDDAVEACGDYAESFAYSRITNPSLDYMEQKLAALEASGKGQAQPYQPHRPASYLRKTFTAPAGESKRLYITAKGLYAAWLNGKRVGDMVLAPGSFTADKSYCNNRLTVAYNPNAPTPKKWLQFLSELLQPEDIPTLQEFLGYCLLPTTKGQKMLMLIGKGGEGKSRIGLVMRSLLGDSMNTTSIQKVESNRFSRADLENKLLMVDDDMDMSALPKTNYIKSIVTSECKMDMERKGVQSYQSQLYVRFLCFGNGALTALHDKSDGFFRRQIVLTTKDRPAGRADDPFLVDKLLREKEGIFLWCLEGLHRLVRSNYQFSISGKARENMETVKRSSNNVIEFLQSEGYIRFRADSEASSKAIYEAYTRWCDDNAQKPMSANRVSSELAQNEQLYNVEATNNVHVGGKRVRGFMGIEVVNPLPYEK